MFNIWKGDAYKLLIKRNRDYQRLENIIYLSVMGLKFYNEN